MNDYEKPSGDRNTPIKLRETGKVIYVTAEFAAAYMKEERTSWTQRRRSRRCVLTKENGLRIRCPHKCCECPYGHEHIREAEIPTISLEVFFEEYENEPDTGEWRERQMEENPSVIINEKEKAIAIEKALNTIPAFWKDIIIMHIVNEVSLGELSKRYGIGKTTLKYNIDKYLSQMRNNCKFLEDFRN